MSIPTIEQVLSARFHCEQAAKYSNAAIWVPTNSEDSIRELFMHSFEQAARELGFTVTPITEALPTEPPAIRDPDSGRPSLVEPAAPSELSHNYGG